jgi:hypothetical protein
MKPSAIALCAACLVCAACGTAPIAPNTPYKADEVSIAPYETFDLCFDAEQGDRVDYRFEASSPAAFSIGYRQHEAVLIPWSRAPAAAGFGVYPVLFAQRYCASWQAGPPGAMLSYTLVLKRRP